MSTHDPTEVILEAYRVSARERSASPACDARYGASRYDAALLDQVSANASNLSMGCGNPFALAELEEGEVVLDLGSGGGLDVILSARRVGPTGRAIGLDALGEMLDLARANAEAAGVTNVEFIRGSIDSITLPDESVDVIISNCVVNLAADKRAVFSEIVRVLRHGGRLAISDIVADESFVTPDDPGKWAECGAGALRRSDYHELLDEVGLTCGSIEITHDTEPGLYAASVRAIRP